MVRTKTITIGNSTLTIEITPTSLFINNLKSNLSLIILISSFIISLLSAIVFRFIIVSQLNEAFLKESHKKLLESEERYNLVVDGMSVGVWDWKIEPEEMYWSEKLKEMFHVKDNTCLSMDYFFNHLHPDDIKRVQNCLQKHLELQDPYDIEYRFKIDNDEEEYGWFHACGRAKWDEYGKPVRMAGSIVDINDRVNVGKSLHESNNLKKAF